MVFKAIMVVIRNSTANGLNSYDNIVEQMEVPQFFGVHEHIRLHIHFLFSNFQIECGNSLLHMVTNKMVCNHQLQYSILALGSVWVDSLQNRKDDIILLDLMVVGTTLTIFIRSLDIFRIPNLWDLA